MDEYLNLQGRENDMLETRKNIWNGNEIQPYRAITKLFVRPRHVPQLPKKTLAYIFNNIPRAKRIHFEQWEWDGPPRESLDYIREIKRSS